MKHRFAWWQHPENRMNFMKAAIMGVLPLLCCLVYCAFQGRGIGEVYLPNSEWNDELFYFKQVESIVNYGYPQGYFGFNESHALKLSFAAWSPVLVFPWVLWGLLFGWNLMSPILCNIVLMIIACFLFGWLARPTWKQLGTWAALFCFYTPFVRYMLSVMPEVICFSLLIVFYGLAIAYQREENRRCLVGMFVLASLLTLMRPYLLLFLLLPSYHLIRKQGWRGVPVVGVVFGVVLVLYWAIKHYLGAEYFAPLFFTDWVDAFLEQGLLGGLRYTFGKLYYMGTDFVNHTLQGFRTGLASGAFFAGFLVCMGILLVQSVRDLLAWNKARKSRGNIEDGNGADRSETECGKATARGLMTIEIHLALCFVAMLFALLLMYKLTEGSKHLLTFMAVAVFVIPMLKTRYFVKPVLLGVTFLYFYSIMALDPYDYQVPFATEERVKSVELWKQETAEKMELVPEGTPNFDNVVIWTFSDVIDGKSVNTQWQLLYGIPKGFGISCCMPDYVKENFDNLQGRYICVVPGGEIQQMCVAAGYEQILEAGNTVLYER